MKKCDFFRINGDFTAAKIGLFASITAGLLAYNQYFINWYTNADGIIEGLTAFTNTTWVLTGCGRWVLAIFTYLSGNIVMPFASVIGFSLCTWLSSFLVAKTWNLKSTLSIVLLSVLMTVTPATVLHFNYNAIAFPYSVAILLGTLYVYINFSFDHKLSCLFSCVCLALTLGIYQCYVGYAAALTLVTMIVFLYNGKDIKEVFQKAGKSIITAIVGGVLYYMGLFVILKLTGLQTTSRMNDVSLSKTITNVFPSILEAYRYYLQYINDHIFQRRFLYLTFILISILCILLKSKTNVKNTVLCLAFVLLVPLASNIFTVILPGTLITMTMSYHYILIVVLALGLVDGIDIKIKSLLRYAVSITCVLLSWTYIISANATFTCYKLSHQYTYGQMSQVVYDIQHNENYVLNETPVIIVGYFEDTALRQNIKTYRYAIDLPENLVFWKVPVGVTYNRQKYFVNYFGLDFKDIDNSEYQFVINSPEFKTMNNWPNENSIKMIDKYLVVKIADNFIK